MTAIMFGCPGRASEAHLRFGLSCVFEYGLVWLLLQAGREMRCKYLQLYAIIMTDIRLRAKEIVNLKFPGCTSRLTAECVRQMKLEPS